MSRMSTEVSEYDSVPSTSAEVGSDELKQKILAVLEGIPDKEWESTSRQNVRPAGERKSFQKVLGLVTGAHWRGIPMPTTDTFRYRGLVMDLWKYVSGLSRGGHQLEATSLQLTKEPW